jgi:DnaK suppressor protein
MRKRELDFFRKLLTRRLEELLMEAERTKDQVKETEEPSSDPMELASNDSDRDFLLRLRDRERKLMVKIMRGKNFRKTAPCQAYGHPLHRL